MATYLKRTSKLFDFSLSRASGDVSLRDLMCPVCRGILIEPVTLPCTHNLCLRCLKGTFEHNSLSCPLCRVRVGSWLRTATKSETLVNSGLWEFIRAKFPKEVEDKYNGDDRDIDLDAGYTAANKILSAAGEIRQEYEAQLQKVEEERRCQRKAEEMASEVLIRKLQAEEQQQQLMQLAHDQLFAKTLAKNQVIDKHSDGTANHRKYPNTSLAQSSFETKKYNVNTPIEIGASKVEDEGMDSGKVYLPELRDASELRRPNIALISKIRAERYASSMKVNANNVQKNSSIKFCCQKPIPVYNTITKTLTQQPAAKVMQPCTSSYTTEPGPSVSKIYGTQSKEELHVPNDIVSSKKKSLGIEVCITSGEDDARIGSAESAGSHDSINQEIHHFKPIRAMPRTPLKISTDGRQIDPKLIRVVPILKRSSNAVPKPPSQAHLKRIIGCSWSAFRGKTKQTLREKEVLRKSAEVIDTEQKASTSCEEVQISEDTLTQIRGTNPRVNFVSEVSYDTNKNYTKSENKFINGVKVCVDKNPPKGILRKKHVKNGMIGKSKRQRNSYTSKRATKSTIGEKGMENPCSSVSVSPEPLSKLYPDEGQQEFNLDVIEKSMERTTRQKSQTDKRDEAESLSVNIEPNNRRITRKRGSEINDIIINDENIIDFERSKEKTEPSNTAASKAKRRKMCRSTKTRIEDSNTGMDIEKSENRATSSGVRKSARNMKYANKLEDVGQCKSIETVANSHDIERQQCIVEGEHLSKSGKLNTMEKMLRDARISDEDIIEDQERIEQLLRQEKEDFELAQRLQAKFDEMTRIAGRTRQARRVMASPNLELDLRTLDIGRSTSKAASASATTQPIDNETVRTEVRKHGRPPKRVK